MIRWLAGSPWRIDSLAFYCLLGCTSVQFRSHCFALLCLRQARQWFRSSGSSVHSVAFNAISVLMSTCLHCCLTAYLLGCLIVSAACLFWIGFELNSWICIWLPCSVCRLTGPLLRRSMPRHSRHAAFSRFPHGWHFWNLIFALFAVPRCEYFYLAVCCLTNYADYKWFH